MHQYLWLTVFLPLFGCIINGFLSFYQSNRRLGSVFEVISGTIGTGVIAVSFGLSLSIFFGFSQSVGSEAVLITTLYEWMSAGSLTVSIAYRADSLSLTMALVVTGVGTLIHLYSIGYMKGDQGYARFFAYLNLFIFSMMNLVLADNLVLLFLGWEGVGLCSYLLIGFWTDRSFEGVEIMSTGDAADKAFIMNRIGDMALLAALFLIFQSIGSFDFGTILSEKSRLDSEHLFWITLLIFIGCTGKSAQLPLYTWLPDAMAGPTPVSALIHAATMVTSGLYLTARLSPLYISSESVSFIIACIGIATALIAATIALVQHDIKKVLAYSTVSQLGYMFLAVGMGAYTAAIFHVVTHAFFKACLFLGSGSVIHAMHEEQDIRKMGGLHRSMPITSITFLLGSCALAGLPLTAGFFSKDEILAGAVAHHGYVFYGIGLITALLTAFYSFRLYTLVFLGTPRYNDTIHPHESPLTMTIPLIILGALSFVGGVLGLPAVITEVHLMQEWLSTSVITSSHELSHSAEWLLLAASGLIALVGSFLGIQRYRFPSEVKPYTGIVDLIFKKYYIDEIYHAVVVKPVQWLSITVFTPIETQIIKPLGNALGAIMMLLSSILRLSQTGVAQHYAFFIAFGFVIILGVFILTL